MRELHQTFSRAVFTSERRLSRPRGPFALLLLLPLISTAAKACAFAPPYRLPVPFSMYAWGSSVALCMSFGVVAVFTRARTLIWLSDTPHQHEPIATVEADWAVQGIGQLLSVALLILCIATGLCGTQGAFSNFNLTFFWVIFVIAVPYLTLLVGDFYETVNPWNRGIIS